MDLLRLGIMMVKRRHIELEIDLGISCALLFEGLQLDAEGFRVYVSEAEGKKRRICVDFGFSALMHRCADEGKYLDTSWESEIPTNRCGNIVWVEQSSFLEWFHRESRGVYQSDNIRHMAILTTDEWVDVLCSKLPEFRIDN
jgi:hypothetical protein